MDKWERRWRDPDYDWITGDYIDEPAVEVKKGIYETVGECLEEGMTAAEIVEWCLEQTYWSKEDVIRVLEEIQEE